MVSKRRGSRRSRGSQALGGGEGERGGGEEGDGAASAAGLATAVMADLDVNECDGRRRLDISVGGDNDNTGYG